MFILFFFFKQKTAYEMRISDWSSDVCSSDLATGHPPAGIHHARLARRHGKHIVIVNVEADALAGPLLAAEAAEAGLVYSLAYGDQPALIAEMVDWARSCGFPVVAAETGRSAGRDSGCPTV